MANASRQKYPLCPRSTDRLRLAAERLLDNLMRRNLLVVAESNAPVHDCESGNSLKVTPVARHDCAADLECNRSDAQVHLRYSQLQCEQMSKLQDGRLRERQDVKSPQRCRRRGHALIHISQIVEVLDAAKARVPARQLFLDGQHGDADIGWRMIGHLVDDGWMVFLE